MSSFEQVFSAEAGNLMRQWRRHDHPLEGSRLLKKTENISIPDGANGLAMYQALRQEFGDAVVGLYTFEKETIPAHDLYSGQVGDEGHPTGREKVPEKTILRYKVNSKVGDKLDPNLRTRIAIFIGNSPTLKTPEVTGKYLAGGN
ncbi:MAG: hypothetical protein PHW75_03100 [Patescibacteria group bacterium]|nr:hypothetical protein [Patescibacteria group bacterium]